MVWAAWVVCAAGVAVLERLFDRLEPALVPGWRYGWDPPRVEGFDEAAAVREAEAGGVRVGSASSPSNARLSNCKSPMGPLRVPFVSCAQAIILPASHAALNHAEPYCTEPYDGEPYPDESCRGPGNPMPPHDEAEGPSKTHGLRRNPRLALPDFGGDATAPVPPAVGGNGLERDAAAENHIGVRGGLARA